jgi:hypothetical protein
MSDIDPLSKSSVQIKIYTAHNDEPVSSATGFIIFKRRQFYLITNWHVVTGINHETGERNKHAIVPNHFKLISHYFKREIYCPLINEEGQKNWLEYPQKKQGKNNIPLVDVVLIPIEDEAFLKELVFNFDLVNTPIKMVPALPVAIIGFPFTESRGLPIWITGFIASEPSENQQNSPLLYVNAAGYSGLSGSPVVVRMAGLYHHSETNALTMDHGYHTKFLGIYSGRIHGKENDSLAICNVWKPEVIDTILK